MSESTKTPDSEALNFASIREKLPRSLTLWRERRGRDMAVLWDTLRPYFEQVGYTLYSYGDVFALFPPLSTRISSTGFMYSLPQHGFDKVPDGAMGQILTFVTWNPLLWAARTTDGRDVVIRTLAIGDDGREHVDLLQLIAAGPLSLQSMNHALPLITTIVFDDITFGVFPKAGWSLRDIYGSWAASSVGDVVNVIGQCLEALAYLHIRGIGHRDAFKDNFLMQWFTEGLVQNYISPSPPRVYINDFELAVSFSPDIPSEQRLTTGPPAGGSLRDKYTRPMPPEVVTGEPYCPFKLDVWQLGFSFKNFRTTIPAIDTILTSLVHPDPAVRPSAIDALWSLQSVVSMIPAVNLRFPPTIQDPDDKASETEESEDTNILISLDTTRQEVDSGSS